MKSDLVEKGLLMVVLNQSRVRLSDMKYPHNEKLRKSVEQAIGSNEEVDENDLYSATWALISRGLAYFDMSQDVTLWQLNLTEKGNAVAEDTEPNPDDPAGYMERLLDAVPTTTAAVQMYLREALHAYVESCFLSSAVMLGVAAEAAMLELADSYVKWAGKPADKFKETLENPRVFYVHKLAEFQKKLAADKSTFPEDIRDSLDLEISAVLQLIRLTRNEAGHPNEKRVPKDACYSHLVIYAQAHKKIHALAQFFLSRP